MNKSLREAVNEFITYKRSIGYVYETPEYQLEQYVTYVEQNSTEPVLLNKEMVIGFLSNKANTCTDLRGSTAVLRQFGSYLSKHGYEDIYIPPEKMYSINSPEPPYFFTEYEIIKFFEAVDTIEPHPSFKVRHIVIPPLFRTLHCCGIRCKEARMLLREKVNFDEQYIDIKNSKGPKSRRLFIGKELCDYLKYYDNTIFGIMPKRKYFFPSFNDENNCLASGAIPNNFNRFWNLAFPDFNGDKRPRAYDFRHHFAWANLNKWSANGLDVNAMLPYLMAYMGHSSIKSTLYYFHFVPEFFSTYNEMAKETESIIPEVQDEER